MRRKGSERICQDLLRTQDTSISRGLCVHPCLLVPQGYVAALKMGNERRTKRISPLRKALLAVLFLFALAIFSSGYSVCAGPFAALLKACS
jgi:hypothetical protein